MKRFLQAILMLSALFFVAQSAAAEKVVVIPLNSSSGGPGNWKNVSVSSLGGITRDSVLRTGIINSPCGDYGRYANASYGVEALTVPIQLPDGAKVVSFTGKMCDNTSNYLGEMILYRSDSVALGHVMTGNGNVSVTSTTTLSVTDTTITSGAEVVDNSKYSYFVLMYINGNAGSALYPVSAIVTLE